MSEDLTKKLTGNDSEKITLILTTVQNLETRVTSLENKVEERLYDTRPIWQKVVADIAQLEEGQRRLQEGQTRLEGDMRDVKISIRDMTRSIGALYETGIRIQAECRDLNHRFLDIELEQQKQRNSST
jgi:chromosome segregation ATPase